MSRSLAAAIALLCSCAGSTPTQKQAWPRTAQPAPSMPAAQGGPPAPAPRRSRIRDSSDCERSARQVAATSPDRGWEALTACVQRGFASLPTLLEPPWSRLLATRSDAATLVMKVVAARGGDVTRDLRLLHQQRFPVFALKAAASQQEVYRTRLVLARVRIGEIKPAGRGFTVRLDEITRALPEQRSGWERPRQDNTFWKETGVQALGRLSRADPFLEPGQDFVVLGRFEGMSESSEDDEVAFPLMSLIAYQAPCTEIVDD